MSCLSVAKSMDEISRFCFVLFRFKNKKLSVCRAWLRTPVIPAAQKAETGESRVQSQPQQLSEALSETLSLNKIQKRAGDVAQWSSAPEFNPQYQTRTTKKNVLSKSLRCKDKVSCLWG